jgi:hypothetical protein
LKKSYRTKINFQGQDELLLEIEKNKSSNKYYVTVSDLKLKYDIEDIKSFNNFEEAKNLFFRI